MNWRKIVLSPVLLIAITISLAMFLGQLIILFGPSLYDYFVELRNRNLLILLQTAVQVIATALAVLATFFVIFQNIRRIREDSETYRAKVESASSSPTREIAEIKNKLNSLLRSNKRGVTVDKLRSELEGLKAELAITVAPPLDVSTPLKLFVVSRERLINEGVRLDGISRRNLMLGIVFSGFALAFLGWPLIAQTVFSTSSGQIVTDASIVTWLSRYYLPRFAVGILLQFVGFFFLGLYVANELDLKHNKNEITNIELKMIALMSSKNSTARKEVLASIGSTERNFIIKKNERLASFEATAEYNDIKSLIEQLIEKIPAPLSRSSKS